MITEGVKCKPTAILSGDVKGYIRLIAKDEAETDNIYLAMGDPNGLTVYRRAEVFNDTTIKLVITNTGSVPDNSFVDTREATHTSENWATPNLTSGNNLCYRKFWELTIP
jgi:hypothetical protein